MIRFVWKRKALAVVVLTLALVLTYCGAGIARDYPPLTRELLELINSDGSNTEFTFSPDGKTIIFSGVRSGSIKSSGDNSPFDIWISRYIDNEWQAPINLGPEIDPKIGPNINTSAWELEPCFSNDGDALYFTRYTEPGNLLSGELFVVQKINGVWQEPKNWNDVPELPSLNSPASEEHCPIIVSDSLIYFCHDQPGVTQASDIWKVEKKDGKWQKPQSLGERINSAARDHQHWTGLSKDGKSLVISSNRSDLASRGQHDQWISHQSQNGEWQEPLNLGDTVNTLEEEMCWTFSLDGKTFIGSSGPRLKWVKKEDIPLLQNFESLGLPPNLLTH